MDSSSKQLLAMTKLSSSAPDIDQLCQIIDESTFGLQALSDDHSLKLRSVPSCQVKAFRSSRLKRLSSSSSLKRTDLNDDETQEEVEEEQPSPPPSRDESSRRSLYPCTRRTFAMRFSLSSSLLHRFRSMSTCHFPLSRRSSHLNPNVRSRHSSSTITLYRTQSTLPAISEEENHNGTGSQLACTRRTAMCNVEELAAYFDHYLYLPKSLSGAAELMYT